MNNFTDADSDSLFEPRPADVQNPWTGATITMTWDEISKFAAQNVHVVDRKNWLDVAETAARAGDAETLGKMIIAS